MNRPIQLVNGRIVPLNGGTPAAGDVLWLDCGDRFERYGTVLRVSTHDGKATGLVLE